MSRRNQATQRNRAAVAQNAERLLADTNYDWLRTSRALLALVVMYVVSTVAMSVCWLAWGSIAGISSVVLWLSVFLLLRVAVRSQADLPDEMLDERMRSERDSVYVGAYRLVASTVSLGATAALIAVEFGSGDGSITFNFDSMSAVFWTLFSLVLGAPSLVLAISQRSSLLDADREPR
ncbi:MAG: hypothetical protein ACK4V6_07470 [Microthrixaceae bacterium]